MKVLIFTMLINLTMVGKVFSNSNCINIAGTWRGYCVPTGMKLKNGGILEITQTDNNITFNDFSLQTTEVNVKRYPAPSQSLLLIGLQCFPNKILYREVFVSDLNLHFSGSWTHDITVRNNQLFFSDSEGTCPFTKVH